MSDFEMNHVPHIPALRRGKIYESLSHEGNMFEFLYKRRAIERE
jgi:hypothetical protein